MIEMICMLINCLTRSPERLEAGEVVRLDHFAEDAGGTLQAYVS